MATSSSASPVRSSMDAMWGWMGSRDALRCLTKSSNPPLYSKTTSTGSAPRSIPEPDLQALGEERHLPQPAGDM